MEIDFENEFNIENIEAVNEEMDEHLSELFAQEESINNMNQLTEIYNKLASYHNKALMNLFKEYSNLKYEEKMYENWLAYYIGYKRGLEEKT